MLAILMAYSFFVESRGLSNQDFLVSSINAKQTGKLYGYLKSMINVLRTINPWKNIADKTDLSLQADKIIMRNHNNVIRPISHEAGQYDHITLQPLSLMK
ncbi:hypothetical protein N42HA_01399 [Lactococcus lactis]|nr:hypothetical protein [Lactococcus lactis]